MAKKDEMPIIRRGDNNSAQKAQEIHAESGVWSPQAVIHGQMDYNPNKHLTQRKKNTP